MKQAQGLLRSVLLAGIALACLPIITGAVLVTPHAVFIDHRQRTGQLTLANPGEEPEEIEIDFVFGYPATDSLGNPYVELIDEPRPDQPSAAEWMRAFPRRLRLEPGQRQVVRLLASPPSDLPDGEHWSRLIVTSRRAAPVAAADSGLRAGITLELRTIISLTYRKGTPETGVTLSDLSTQVEGDSLVTWLGLERDGNAAYLGSVKIVVLDNDESVVREWSIPVAVYYEMHRRLALPLDGIPSGAYRVRFDLSTAREDIPQTNILPATPITRAFRIEVG
jgi:P pilus assembly chaperone PapD